MGAIEKPGRCPRRVIAMRDVVGETFSCVNGVEGALCRRGARCNQKTQAVTLYREYFETIKTGQREVRGRA